MVPMPSKLGADARKVALQPAPEQRQQLQQPPTVFVNAPQQQFTEASSSPTVSPTNKEKPRSGTSALEAMLEKGAALHEFQMDIARRVVLSQITGGKNPGNAQHQPKPRDTINK